MAVIVTDTRSVFVGATTGSGDADSLTDWTGTGASLGLNNSTFAEALYSITAALNIATGSNYLSLNTSPAAQRDLSDTMIYIQSYNAAIQGGWDSGGTNNTHHGIYLSDGTREAIFHMAGNDKNVFKHADGQVQFQCLLLDGAQASQWNTDGHVTMLTGAFGDLNMAAITQVGIYYETLSKGLGGGWTIATDIMRYGNGGLTIIGGLTGDRGTFAEICVEDRSTADGKAHGIIREYSTGIYGVQGSLTFGNTVTGISYFEEDGVVVAYENRPVANDKYSFNVVGATGGGNETYFILTNSTITTAGPLVTCDFSDAGINTLTITGCSFTGLGNAISFGNDAAAASHTITNNTFIACGQIDPGDTDFTDNTIQNTTDANGGLLIDADGTSALSDLSFISDSTGHAIYIDTTGTYTFTNFTYSGYGATGTADAVVFNDSGGPVTINVSGGDSPTYKNGISASTSIVSSVNVGVRVQDTSGTAIQYAQVFIRKATDYYNYTSHATNNTAGLDTFEVIEAVDTELPQSGWIHVWDADANTKQNYRYQSWTGKIFTLNAEKTGTANAGGSSTTLKRKTGTSFLTEDIKEGDTVRDTTDTGAWAIVDEIVDADTITTTPLQGGTNNTWAEDDGYSFHRLAILYAGTDLVDIPLFNGQTDASGDISTTFGGSTPADITVRIRSNEEATKYVPYTTSGSIPSEGYALTAVLTEDGVAA